MKVGVTVGGIYDKLHCWMFKKGLRFDFMFREKVGLERVYNLIDLIIHNIHISIKKKNSELNRERDRERPGSRELHI